MDLTGVRADGNGDGAADEKEEQVIAEGEGGSEDPGGGDGAEAEAKEETKVED